MTRTHSTPRPRYSVLLAALLALAGCDDESLMPPAADAGDLFARYVAFGNSITAGFQSFGINDSTQLDSYAARLAHQFGLQVGTEFVVPLFNRPGCPAPLINVFTGERVGGTAATDCAFRRTPVPSVIHNVALPGAEVLEAMDYTAPPLNMSPTDAFKTLILGGRTEVAAAAAAAPTFVTVWLGNNDILDALITDGGNAGDPSLFTPPALFADRYGDFLAALDGFGSIQGGVLIGVVQVAFAPFASTGRAYFAAAQQIPTLTVEANCLEGAELLGAPNDSVFVLVPFTVGAPLVAQAAAGVATTLDCSGPEVVTAAEAVDLFLTVAQYNATIEAEATARGWAFLDPNPLLLQLLADPTALRPFPAFPPDPASVATPFGSAVSRDGLHPSGATHGVITNALIAAINATYGTSVQPLP